MEHSGGLKRTVKIVYSEEMFGGSTSAIKLIFVPIGTRKPAPPVIPKSNPPLTVPVCVSPSLLTNSISEAGNAINKPILAKGFTFPSGAFTTKVGANPKNDIVKNTQVTMLLSAMLANSQNLSRSVSV